MAGSTLIAITSCAKDVASGVNRVVRETWACKLKALGFDYKFFIGTGQPVEYDPRFLVDLETHKKQRPSDAVCPPLDIRLLKGDEVLVECPDDWLHLAFKIQASRLWAVRQGYDHIFKIDVDCILEPSKLHTSNYKQFDYWGSLADSKDPLRYAGGWMGYALSKRAAILTVNAPVTRVTEDCWTAEVLKKHGIKLEAWSTPVTKFLSLGHGRYTAEMIRKGAAIAPPIPVSPKPLPVYRGHHPILKTQKRLIRPLGRKTR